MKKAILICFVIASTAQFSSAQQRDTVEITGNKINHAAIKYGNASYLVFNKKTKESAATGFYVANMNIAPVNYDNQPAIAIRQRWEARDTFAHTATTILKAGDLSTLLHETHWMRLPYSTTYDFVARKVSFDGTISDSTKAKLYNEFSESFGDYNLNWHSDLFIFTVLPYKANRSFKINFYDPGFGKPKEVVYDVTGSEKLDTYAGKVDCWVMEYKHPGKDYQRFWIDKQNKEVVKEEDFFNNQYRYKIKLEVAENNG